MYRDFLGKTWSVECMGCGIGSGSNIPPFGFIKKSPHFVVHQDPLVALPGFIVIASKRHIQNIEEMEPLEFDELNQLIYRVRKGLFQLLPEITFTLIQEENSKHFHLWFFPWHPWISIKNATSLSEIRPICEILKNQIVTPEILDQCEKICFALRNYLTML